MRDYVLKNGKAKLVWDFDISLRKTQFQGDQTWYLKAKRNKKFGFVI